MRADLRCVARALVRRNRRAGVITCAEHVLANVNDGRVIVALLYLVPVGLLFYVISQGVRLAYSF